MRKVPKEPSTLPQAPFSCSLLLSPALSTMESHWLWYDRNKSLWALSSAGSLQPKVHLAEVLIDAPAMTRVLERGRRVLEVEGKLVVDGESGTLGNRYRTLDEKLTRLEKDSHPPHAQRMLDELRDRVAVLEAILRQKIGKS